MGDGNNCSRCTQAAGPSAGAGDAPSSDEDQLEDGGHLEDLGDADSMDEDALAYLLEEASIEADVEAFIAHHDNNAYWIHELGACSYEVFSEHGLLGEILIGFWTVSTSFRVKCKTHTRCAKLVGQKGRSTADMLSLLATWLSVGPSMSQSEHLLCRPS